MIINTGQRTDIPAYFSEWFFNRIKAGYVLVRNPYYPNVVTRYELNENVVDVLSFCTKNPQPMLKRMDEIKNFNQFWFVTITPYGKDIEPNVPDKKKLIESFKKLSDIVGKKCVALRYDPIFISDKYNIDYHIRAFRTIAESISGYTEQVVISFIDLYEKTKRNFPLARVVTKEERLILGESFSKIAKEYNLTIRTCCEGTDLVKFGINADGCLTKDVLENAIGEKLNPPKKKSARPDCNCLLGNDIGMYNTCMHMCKYCYANYDKQTVLKNVKLHDPNSPLLIGNLKPSDVIKNAKQSSYISNQLSF